MSGKKKKAKREAKEAQQNADLEMGRENWANYHQWKFEAKESRDANVRTINQKYGTQNQKLRDILATEEDRKYQKERDGIESGKTGMQLDSMYKTYGIMEGYAINKNYVQPSRQQAAAMAEKAMAGGTRTIGDERPGRGPMMGKEEYLTSLFGAPKPQNKEEREAGTREAAAGAAGRAPGGKPIVEDEEKSSAYFGW